LGGKDACLKIRYARLADAPEGTLFRANSSDAGLDLCSSEDLAIPPGQRKAVPTGIAVEIPDGYYGRVAPRSGLAVKHGIDVLAGVIDSGYRGEIRAVLLNTDSEKTFEVRRGDRIAQLIVERHYNFELEEAENLSHSDRGSAGFGSSG